MIVNSRPGIPLFTTILRLNQVIGNHSKRTLRYPFLFNFSIRPDTRSFALSFGASFVIVISTTSPLVNLRQKNHRQIEFYFFIPT